METRQMSIQEYDGRAYDASMASDRDAIVRRLALGVECGECAGSGSATSGALCGSCDGTGYRVPPYDLRWALDWPDNDISADQSAEIIACSVARVRAGLGPVDGLFQEESRPQGQQRFRRIGGTFERGRVNVDAVIGIDGAIACPWPEVAP